MGVLVEVLEGVAGVVGGCGCGMGSLFVLSRLEVVVWWGGLGCYRTVGIHALYCRRFSCAGAVFVLVWRVHCRLPVPAFLFVCG